METLSNKRQQHGDRQTLTNKKRRPPPAGPRWLILKSRIDEEGGDSSVANAETTASCCTPSGKIFSISFGIATPPACCSLHFDWHGDGKPKPNDVRVIAGHDDAVLIQMSVPKPKARCTSLGPSYTHEHFLYQAGSGSRLPSLLLLPSCNILVQSGYRNHSEPNSRFRHLSMENTGILRRGDDDAVVCQFEITWDPPIYYTSAELCILRIGGGDWIVRQRVPILEHREGSSELQPWHPKSLYVQAAVPVGNRFLCWVDYCSGFLLCDMAEEENPKLRYVPLPAMATQDDAYWLDDHDLRCCRTLGAAGPDTVRFVIVAPPRCGAGETLWERSKCFSFSVMTWTLTLSTEEATTWEMDIVLDCDEIWKWRLPNWGHLPRDKHLEYPMVRCTEPDVICFRVEGMALEINTRSKKLLSVVPSGIRQQDEDGEPSRLITAKLHW